MRVRGYRRGVTAATALSVPLVGSVIGGVPAPVPAHALPAPADGPAARHTPDRAESGLPGVWPRPQQLRARGGGIPVGARVALVAATDADPYALDVIRAALRDAGATTVYDVPPGAAADRGGPAPSLVVYAEDTGYFHGASGPAAAGPRGASSAAEIALGVLGAPPRGDLPAGGYRLAAGRAGGRPTVALSGVGPDGLFHAAQTLRQLIRHGSVAGVTVRDWPRTAVRGTAEDFYGEPWSHRERLAQLDFLGRTKQNRYLYAPGDDPYRQAKWRDPYPAGRRAGFRELAERARRNHVTLAWAVQPGQGFCFASDRDRRDLLRKADAMWALGFRAFQLQFQDVSYREWHCGADGAKYGSGPEAAAKAQAETANALARHLAERHPGAAPLSLMPTEYYQKGPTDYRKALAARLDRRTEVVWTGVGVVPRTITRGELAGARAAFHHPVATQDNYPVNDFAEDRVFLGPYTGRDPAVATGSAALLANAMEQPVASRIPLFTMADYAWNPDAYDPDASWPAAIDDLAGQDAGARAALRALAGNTASSVLGSGESAYLRGPLAAFLKAYAEDDAKRLAREGKRLKAAFRTMHDAPQRLADIADGTLAAEVRPWTAQLARYGSAGGRAVDMLLAQARGDGSAAWHARTDVERIRAEISRSPATVGKGVLGPFLAKAAEESDGWLGVGGGGEEADGGKKADGAAQDAPAPPSGGPSARSGAPRAAAADGDVATAYAAARAPSPRRGDDPPAGSDALTIPLRPQRLRAVTVLTGPGSGTRARVEVHEPGGGWRRLGDLAAGGWTELAAKGVRADAVRLVWAADGDARPPVVHEVIPWSADQPDARLALHRGEADVAIGGRPVTVEAELAAQTPGEARGRLTAPAPEGLKARVPGDVTVRRGGRTTARIEVSAPPGTPPGTYEIPVSLDDGHGGTQRRTVTVRAYPQSAGPDLARTAKATSSADETPDFPADAATDGDPRTRWSSPAEDGQWLQLELARPARVGEVTLSWQEAYASRYRIAVSADGRHWRTAARVKDGKGGRETVRMDARDVRYLRIEGEERATEWGVSLFSVDVRAVRD